MPEEIECGVCEKTLVIPDGQNKDVFLEDQGWYIIAGDKEEGYTQIYRCWECEGGDYDEEFPRS